MKTAEKVAHTPQGQAMKITDKMRAEWAKIPTNIIAATDCAWCQSNGDPHSPACPLGERSKYIQSIESGLAGVGLPLEAVEMLRARGEQ